MEKKLNRRQFLARSITGAVALGAGIGSLRCAPVYNGIDRVSLGSTGLLVPRLAIGTGTSGGGGQTNQTRMGMPAFVKLARHAYDKGLRFFDTADSYGSHIYVREVLKQVPREDAILLTKIWPHPRGGENPRSVAETLDRFRLETGSDYFDIMLLHYQRSSNWPNEIREQMDALSKAQQDGIIRKVGVSCHSLEALETAASEPWVEVIMARINPYGTHMDASPEEVMPVLETARKNGKGIIGMKIFGQGTIVSDEERQRSLMYTANNPNIHCLTLGFESTGEVDDAINRVMAICTARACC
jgi:1-deoxyxylulose-5-phosphate synthase